MMKKLMNKLVGLTQMKNKFTFNQVKDFNNYIDTPTIKNKIVIHGTFGGTGTGTISWFKNGSGQGVSTHFIIDQNGKIYRLFDQEYFAYHAGGNFRQLSRQSFGIQIVNWLNVTKDSRGVFYSWTGKVIQPERVKQVQTWRGKEYFQTITQNQHKSLEYLLKYLCQKYDIKKKFYRNYDENLPVNNSNFSGILQHSTFHKTKMDFEPSIVPTIRI